MYVMEYLDPEIYCVLEVSDGSNTSSVDLSTWSSYCIMVDLLLDVPT